MNPSAPNQPDAPPLAMDSVVPVAAVPPANQQPQPAAPGPTVSGQPAAAPAKPAAEKPNAHSNSTQNSLQIAEIRDGIVIMNDGSFRSVVMVKSINFDLMSQQEQEAVEYSYQGFLNSLYFQVQIFLRSQKIDLQPYIEKLDKIRTEHDNMLLALLMEDYIQYIDFYHERIRAFHVKDAEFNSTGKQGTFGGYQSWLNRAGRYRSPGDGQVDFKTIFSKLTEYDFQGWAVMEWECCLKHPEDGAREGAEFIQKNIIRVTERAFDDFAGVKADTAFNRALLGLS